MPTWADWYSGSMAPPMRDGQGGLVQAPNSVPQMSVEQMYEGIYGPSSSGLTTKQVQVVAVDPFTGQPIVSGASGNMAATREALSATGNMTGSSGRGFAFDPARASVAQAPYPMTKEVVEPGYTREGVGFEAGNAYGPQHRLVPETPALTATSKMAGKSGAGFAFNPFSASIPGQADIMTLSFDPMSPVSGQNMANSTGKPIKFKSGQVYYPMQEYGPPPVAGAPAVAAALQARQSPAITAPGGGGAYVAPKGSFIESVTGSGALVPAALNTPRWTETSKDSSNPSWW